MINRRFLRPNAANSMQNKKFQRHNAANSMQHGRFSSKMLQITRKMKGSSSKMLQIACSMEGKWQDRCRGRKTEQIRKKKPGAGEKSSPARFGTRCGYAGLLMGIYGLWIIYGRKPLFIGDSSKLPRKSHIGTTLGFLDPGL